MWVAALSMPQFLQKHGLRLLAVSDEGVVPGVILAKKKLRPIASLEQLLDGTSGKWTTKLMQGHIVDEITWERNLGGRISLNIPGIITIGAGLKRAKRGAFSISKVSVRAFTKADLMEVPLKLRLGDWSRKQPNKKAWKMIDGHWFGESTWFCEEYTLDFQVQAGADLKADVVGDVTVGAGADIKWVSKTKLKVTGNDKVPFAAGVWEI